MSPPADVVLLAAGRSSRMGQPKGLFPHRGRPWLESQLAAVEGRRAVVVLGLDRALYLAALPGLASRPGVVVAVNPDPDRGPFSSLQVGLAALGAPAVAPVFVLPVDVPAASAPTWRALEDALGPTLDAAIPTHEGRGGHPVLLAPPFVAQLGRRDPASPDSRLDALLRLAKAILVPVGDPRVRLNLNAPEDWGKLGGGT
ncbi:MAG TPA: NTP transferase domain-containing protein [Polyangiaceae bacterium]|nr:NTP transferase domain-containing protein [Polyangiaceae bacterium]